MLVKFRARNSGIYLGRDRTRNGVYWVDDAGEWQPFSPLAESVVTSEVASRGLFFHMGAVRVEIFELEESIHISWAVRSVNLHTLSEVLDFLDFFRRGYRVILRYYCEGWVQEHYNSEQDAILAIMKSQKFRDRNVSDSVFIRGMDALTTETATPFIQNGLEIWHKGRGAIKSEPIAELLPNLLIYQYRETDGHLMALRSGPAAACRSVFQKGWVDDDGSRPYDYDYPSQRYNELITKSYQRVFDSGEIWFDHIRAIIPRRGEDPHWVSYQRLLFPLLLDDGSQALGCLSDISPENAIPVLGGA